MHVCASASITERVLQRSASRVDALAFGHTPCTKRPLDLADTKAMTFQHTERLTQGTYYVVMRDTSLGILSASTSDISLRVRVEP